MTGFYTLDELASFGFKQIGENVLISNQCRIFSPHKIEIGSNVRIDDFCILSGGKGVKIGSNVHVASHCNISGGGGIFIGDYSGFSTKVSIFSASDDFSGISMTNPTIPDAFKRVTYAPVTIHKHVIVGANSVVLPGVTINEGCAIGALTLIKNDCEAFSIYSGNPAQKVGNRLKGILKLEKKYLELINNDKNE
jgi:galactoside O-acetyltransferase